MIKKILIAVVIIIVFLLVLLVLVSPSAEDRARDEGILISMTQLNVFADHYYEREGNYAQLIGEGLVQAMFLAIEFHKGELVVEISSSGKEYCAYSQLIARKGWFCIDSTGATGWTDENPVQSCGAGHRYECPSLNEKL